MSETCKSKITIEGKDYVLTPVGEQPAEKRNGMKYCLIRTYSAGVFCGYVASREGTEVTLLDAIRLWKWSGAASLSQLAMEGVKSPDGCKFAMPITTELILSGVIEATEMTEAAKSNVQSVKSWKM